MKIIIADQSLVDYMGHSYEYARSISDYAKTQGDSVNVLAHISVSDEIMENLIVVPCFRYGLDHCFQSKGLINSSELLGGRLLGKFRHSLKSVVNQRLLEKIAHTPKVMAIKARLQKRNPLEEIITAEWNYREHNRTLYEDLCTVEKDLNLKGDTLFLFHTIRHNQITPIVRWAERIAHTRSWFALIFHFTAYPDFYSPSLTARFYQRSLNYLEHSYVKNRFHLFADSQDLIFEYKEYTNFPVRLVPVPHANPSPSPIHEDSMIDKQGGIEKTLTKKLPIRFTYLGDARKNKGFHFLPYVFSHMKLALDSGDVLAEIQANVRIQSEWEVQMAISQLERLNGIILHHTPLSSRQYYEILYRADIVVLPYTTEYYHSQTSGIFCEALAYGKPVIIPRGTWMAKQLNGFGGITFLPGDRQSLLEAFLKAFTHYEELRRDALSKVATWNHQHSIRQYIKTIKENITK